MFTKNMKIFASLLIAVLFFAGCGGGFETTKTVSANDPNIITYTTPKLRVKGEFETKTYYTELQFFCFQEGESRSYSISASYVTNQWPYFEKFIFTIDGSEFEFFPDRPPTRDAYNIQGPTETITVQIPEKTVRDIYESMDTKMTIKGMDIAFDVYWKDHMKLKLYEFYKETIEE
ncbi:MAG: hypothetical protein U5K00_18335 [Melioribacteraceae bacterium]|nr:hypothetical protein [Melioribacteraceae bacterium]